MSPNAIRSQLVEVARARLESECRALAADRGDVAGRVRAAVTELAVLYGQLYGRNFG